MKPPITTAQAMQHPDVVLTITTLGQIADELRARCAELERDAAPCVWTLDDEESGTWSSSCGELWSFIDGGPKENRVTYCHHCGKPVELTSVPKGEANHE